MTKQLKEMLICKLEDQEGATAVISSLQKTGGPVKGKVDERRIVQYGDRFLRLREVMDLVGLRHAAIYDKISKKQFPAPYPIGDKARGFLESEIREWMQQRVDARGGCHGA